MTKTSTITRPAPPQTLNLNLASLKTVVWVADNPVLRDARVFTHKHLYSRAREVTIFNWILGMIEFQLIWLWTLVHTVPWPAWILGSLQKVDSFVETILEATYQRLDWWYDQLSIRLMWAIETALTYLDKAVTLVDNVIGWVMGWLEWGHHLVLMVLTTVQATYAWLFDTITAFLDYLWLQIGNVQQLWSDSQEELKSQIEVKEKFIEELSLNKSSTSSSDKPRLTFSEENGEFDDHSRKSSLSYQRGSEFDEKPALSFSVEDEFDDSRRSSLAYRRVSDFDDSRRGSLYRRSSDSDCSDVTGVQETMTLLVGEQTGQAYRRVHTEGEVVGRQRDAMSNRVDAQLKIMRKNSVRFSRGMDVVLSRYIARMQKRLTPRSLMSNALSLIRFFILLPFKVLLWLVGSKKSKKSRGRRTESMRRRAAAAAAATGAGVPSPPLGPAALLQSAEPTPPPPTRCYKSGILTTTHSILKPGIEIEDSTNSVRGDSGYGDDNHELSDENILNNSTTKINNIDNFKHINNDTQGPKSNDIIITNNVEERPIIKREPTVVAAKGNLVVATPVKAKRKISWSDMALPSRLPPKLAGSEPDLRNSALINTLRSADVNARSVVSAPDDDTSPPSSPTRSVKKRVTIK